MADLPGVQREELTINIDQGILTLESTPALAKHGEDIFREFEIGGYFRQFKLPETVDADKTSGELKNGVLTLHLPKAESAKPRRIEISVH